MYHKLQAAIEQNNSLLCVGLDPDPVKYPDHFHRDINAATLSTWGRNIIEQTADLVCAYKPNIAFYEQFGSAGLSALKYTISQVPDHIPVLLDAKRGDIGSTAAAYAAAAFKDLRADGVTLSPYLGEDSIAPFLSYPDKMVFVLAYTSNPSAAAVQSFGGAPSLFEHIVSLGQQWGNATQLGFVIGATQPHALQRFRTLVGDAPYWVLAPGVGAQGGDVTAALNAGLTARGDGVIVPVSRGVLYADNPHQAALDLRDQINQARANRPSGLAVHPHRDLILGLHDVGCVQFGSFTLASGKQSPIYVDLRRLGASPRLLKLAARAYADMLGELSFDLLAGVPYAALPIGTAVAMAMDKPLIYPRKETKAYGTGKTIEGVYQPGDRVVVIEDLVTSGGSVLKAIDTLKAADLSVQHVGVLIDREQGGPQNMAAAGYTLHAALTLSQILTVLVEAGKISAATAQAVTESMSGE